MSWLIIHEWILLGLALLLGFLLSWLFCRKKSSGVDQAEYDSLKRQYQACQKEQDRLREEVKVFKQQGNARPSASRPVTQSMQGVLPVQTAQPKAKTSQPDDLKRIKGIGVKLEKTLNGIGITQYHQIASWSVSDIEKINEQLKFKGRIDRENWVRQAKLLSSGENTDFAKRYDQSETE